MPRLWPFYTHVHSASVFLHHKRRGVLSSPSSLLAFRILLAAYLLQCPLSSPLPLLSISAILTDIVTPCPLGHEQGHKKSTSLSTSALNQNLYDIILILNFYAVHSTIFACFLHFTKTL